MIALQGLNGRWPGVTVNVGVVEGGTRTNVVPAACRLQVDLRAPAAAALDEAEAEIERICAETRVEGTELEVRRHGWHRPMEKDDAAQRLVDLAVGIARELGFELHDAATGGASDANTTSAAGTPTIDGLGPVGGDDHAPAEWLDLSSVVPRISLLAGLIRARMSTEWQLDDLHPDAYRSLVEGVPAILYIDRPDEASTNLYTSPQVEDLMGFTLEEWTSDPELWRDLLHPDDADATIEPTASRTNAASGSCRVPDAHEGRADRLDPRRGQPRPRPGRHAPVLARRDARHHRPQGSRGRGPPHA